MITRLLLTVHYYRKYGYHWQIAWSLAKSEYELFQQINKTRKLP